MAHLFLESPNISGDRVDWLGFVEKDADEPKEAQAGDEREKVGHVFHAIAGFVDLGHKVRGPNVKKVSRGKGNQKIGPHLERQYIPQHTPERKHESGKEIVRQRLLF